MTNAQAESAIAAAKEKNAGAYEQQSDVEVNGTEVDAANMQNVSIEPDEPSENNPSLADLEKQSKNISRMTDKGIINEVAGASMTIRESGQINLASSKEAQYKLNPKGRSIEYTMESTTVTNRKRIYTDEIVVNDHKLNPKIYELTDFKKVKLPTNQEALVGNFCVCGSVLVKAWEANLKRYVMIRRPARLPLFSPLLNLPKIMPELGITDPLEYEEDIYAYDTEKGYQVNGVISDAQSLIDIKNGKILDGKDRAGINRDFKMTIGEGNSTSAASSVSAGNLGGGNVDPKVVYQFLKKCGYNDIAAAAILGNIQQECSFNSGIPNAQGSGAYGLIQWLNDRRANMESYCKSKGKPTNDAGCQLEFMWQELQTIGYYKSCLPASLNNKGINEASEEWQNIYEGAPGQDTDKRKTYAAAHYAKITSGAYR